jgi:hypothetical protein
VIVGHLQESTFDFKPARSCAACTFDAQFAAAKQSHHRCMTSKDPEESVESGRYDVLGVAVEENLLW